MVIFGFGRLLGGVDRADGVSAVQEVRVGAGVARFYTPVSEEITWARVSSGSDEHLLALVVWVKAYDRMGWFPRLRDVPDVVVDYVRRELALPEDVRAVVASTRTGKRFRTLVRGRHPELTHDPAGARKIAADEMRKAAERKNDPADLINVALERLVAEGYELPAFSTLDAMCSTIREWTNARISAMVIERLGPRGVVALDGLLRVVPPARTSDFDRLKRVAPRPSWTNFKRQLEHLAWVDSLGDSPAWWAGVLPSKIAAFTGEAEAADAAMMGDYAQPQRAVVLAAMVHAARAKARDDVAEMFCRRVVTLTKRARQELERKREEARAASERLVVNYRDLLERLDPEGTEIMLPASGVGSAEGAAVPVVRVVIDAEQAAALQRARKQVEAAGGFDAEYEAIETVSEYHGDNHVPLVARHFKKDRSAMLQMVAPLGLIATSSDDRVLRLLDHMRDASWRNRDFLPDRIPKVDDETGQPVLDPVTGVQLTRVFDTGFASENWNRAIRDRRRPEQFRRRELEACVLTYLAEELRTGDIAVTGAEEYADWTALLLSEEEVAEKLPEFLERVGLPATGGAFCADLRDRLTVQAKATDSAFPENADFAIVDGKPKLTQFKAAPLSPTARALREAMVERMPERSLMSMLARTAHWLEWWRRFGPASGSDPKIADPFFRYTLTVFC